VRLPHPPGPADNLSPNRALVPAEPVEGAGNDDPGERSRPLVRRPPPGGAAMCRIWWNPGSPSCFTSTCATSSMTG